MSGLVILHTNDMHNRLRENQAARLRQIVEEERAKAPCLLLDAGDAVGAGNVTFNPAGEPILDLMSDIGYDAMTVGNREFHFTEVGFHTKLNRARFPVLCANVRPRGEARLPVQPSLILSVGTVRVGIIGLTVPMITERMLSRRVSAYVFDDPIRRGCEMAEELHPQVDLLIALTHIGLSRDLQIAQATDKIDLIIGGHSHTLLEQPLREGRTTIVQAGSYARFVGRVTVQVDDCASIDGGLLHLVQPAD
ncbi:MAG: bifunctional metallophosphatase/5'-nucleotidase [Armatimonadota bacterium]